MYVGGNVGEEVLTVVYTKSLVCVQGFVEIVLYEHTVCCLVISYKTNPSVT